MTTAIADPYPALKYWKTLTNIHVPRTWVEFPGPPLVIANTRSNTLNDSITERAMTMTFALRRPGIVTFQNCCHQFAPSTRADS